MATTRQRISAAVLAVIVSAVGGYEGLRTKAYLDPVNVPTICFGETKGVKLGQTKTPAECSAMLADRLQETNQGVRACIHEPMTAGQEIAFTSAAYNIGVPAFCGSSMVRYFNGHNAPMACNSLLLWNKAGGKVLPGLTVRREEERAYCIGVHDASLGKMGISWRDSDYRIYNGLGSKRLAAWESGRCCRRGSRETGRHARTGILGRYQGGAGQAYYA